jgi:WD40 repeat protein
MRTFVVILALAAAPLAPAQGLRLPPSGPGPKEGRPSSPPRYLISAAAISPDGALAATGYTLGGAENSPMIRLWDAATGKELRAIPGRDPGVRYLAFTADGKQLLSGDGDYAAFRLWDVKTGEEVRAFTEDGYQAGACGLSADGKHLLTAGVKHTGRPHERDEKYETQCKLWEVSSGKLISAFRPSSGGPFGSSLCVSADGRRMLHHGKLMDTVSGETGRSFDGDDASASRSAFSPDGKYLVIDMCQTVSASRDEDQYHLMLWNLDKDEWVKKLPVKSAGAASAPHTAPYAHVILFSPDGKVVLTADRDGMLRAWDLDAGKEKWAVECDCRAAAFVADGKEVLLVRVTPGPGREQLYFQYRDAATGEQLRNR